MVQVKNGKVYFPSIAESGFKYKEDFLKAITVTYDIKGNGVFMPEFQRYNKWANAGFLMSQSTMHAMEKFMTSTDHDPFTKYVSQATRNEAKKNYLAWKAAKESGDKKQIYDTFETLVHNLPRGFELWATINSNYLQLKTQVIQRFGHKNQHDWGAVVEFCYSLPKFRELCGFEDSKWDLEKGFPIYVKDKSK